mmetsp:Transcript_20864/g.47035  ORF Transcript_20864/g.47035 Transcript_20864/m.47035 type:complete len:342 (+) Transcript_20864:1-1026(+)
MQIKQQGTTSFAEVSLGDKGSMERAMAGSDLVIHTAGPFQGGKPQVLEAAIAAGVAYMDVCDDVEYCQEMKTKSEAARAAGIPAVTTCGIYPGLSNVMAAALVRQAQAKGSEPQSLKFSYFTAGTGGVGGTILASTFLLMAEDCKVYRGGEEVCLPALSEQRQVDFGPRIGTRRTMLLNLPEVVTAHQVLGVPDVDATFGTAPEFWNVLLEAIVKVVPRSLLGDREFAANFAKVSLPINRVVDAVVGSAAGMRVSLTSTDGSSNEALCTVRYLSQGVGIATAAFAFEMLEAPETIPAGVHFPEEAISPDRTAKFLARATKGAVDMEGIDALKQYLRWLPPT